MTTTGKFSMKGLENYLETIAQAGENIDEAAANATHEGAIVAQSGMVSRVPVLTGNLREHIRVYGPETDGNYSFCEVGILHNRGMTDAETARYGNAQEYGTSSMPAQPYIRPTIKEDGAKVKAAMRKSLKSDGVL
jgi:HK97 gp10 family phage protein